MQNDDKEELILQFTWKLYKEITNVDRTSAVSERSGQTAMRSPFLIHSIPYKNFLTNIFPSKIWTFTQQMCPIFWLEIHWTSKGQQILQFLFVDLMKYWSIGTEADKERKQRIPKDSNQKQLLSFDKSSSILSCWQVEETTQHDFFQLFFTNYRFKKQSPSKV